MTVVFCMIPDGPSTGTMPVYFVVSSVKASWELLQLCEAKQATITREIQAIFFMERTLECAGLSAIENSRSIPNQF